MTLRRGRRCAVLWAATPTTRNTRWLNIGRVNVTTDRSMLSQTVSLLPLDVRWCHQHWFDIVGPEWVTSDLLIVFAQILLNRSQQRRNYFHRYSLILFQVHLEYACLIRYNPEFIPYPAFTSNELRARMCCAEMYTHGHNWPHTSAHHPGIECEWSRH